MQTQTRSTRRDEVQITNAYGQFTFPREEYIAGKVTKEHHYEQEWIELFLDHLRERPGNPLTVVDAGGFMGTHAIAYASAEPRVKVLSFEPHPFSYKYLHSNVRVNELQGRIETFMFPLADRVRTFNLNARPPSLPEGQTFNTGGVALRPARMMQSQINVSAVALDDFLVPRPAVDGIKIDVEGAERMVLWGARETIARYHPILYVEFHPVHTLPTEMRELHTQEQLDWDIQAWLEGHRYAMTVLSTHENRRDLLFF